MTDFLGTVLEKHDRSPETDDKKSTVNSFNIRLGIVRCSGKSIQFILHRVQYTAIDTRLEIEKTRTEKKINFSSRRLLRSMK